MSNDLRYWMSRFGILACLIISISLLLRGLAAGLDLGLGHGSRAAVYLWFTLFFVSLVLSLPIFFWYYRRKDQRWESAQRDAERLAIETLAAMGKPQPKQESQGQLPGAPANNPRKPGRSGQ